MTRRTACSAANWGTAGRLRQALLGTTILATILVAAAAPAWTQVAPNAAPTGGKVVAGVASISQSPTTTLIQQGSQRTAIDWGSFDVGSRQTVQFKQPNSTATALNRVIGPDPSQIAGHITANGELVLVNQSGVIFTPGSQVNAQALVVSSANIGNQAFMAGGVLHFDRPGSPNARIVNEGTITVGQAGLAALVAPAVVNSGVITAQLGQVTLGAARRFTLDLYGDGLAALDVTGLVTSVPVGRDGAKVAALVTNTGTILANGGTVTLTAAAADGLIKTLVSAGGHIGVDNAGGSAGTLVLDAVGGSIVIDGALTATGQTGGQVQAIASRRVAVKAAASIDASGAAAGGLVALGTTLARAAGGASVVAARTARSVSVAAGATIRADATGAGSGGRVTLLSRRRTAMAGSISARGGASGGDGGFVEVSGNAVSLTGLVDASAPVGHVGMLLIDPNTYVYISDSPPPNLGAVYPDASYVSTASLSGSAVSAEVDATNGIFLASGTAGGEINDLALTLKSGGTIAIDRGFTISAASVDFSAGGDITFGTTHGADVGLATSRQITNLGSADLLSTTITLAASGSIDLVDSDIVGTGIVTLRALGSITQAVQGTVTTSGLTANAGGDIDLFGTSNLLAVTGPVSASGGVTMIGTGTLSISNSVTGTSVFIDVMSAGTANGELLINPSTTGEVIGGLTGSSSNLVSLIADSIVESSPSIAIQAETVQIAPSDGIAINLGSSSGTSGPLGIDTTLIGDIAATTLVVGGVAPLTVAPSSSLNTSSQSVQFGTEKANGLTVTGAIAPGSPTLDIASTKGVTTAVAGSITVGTLESTSTITGGDVILSATGNSISDVQSFYATGGVTLADSVPLTISGAGLLADTGATGAALQLTYSGPGTHNVVLTVLGPLASCAGSVTIDAPSIDVGLGGFIWNGSSTSGMNLAPATVNIGAGGTIASAANISLGTGALFETGGTVLAAGSLDASAVTLSGGLLAVGTLVTVLTFSNGTFASESSLNYATSQSIGSGQTLESGGSITFTGGLTQTGGLVAATTDIVINTLFNQSGGIVAAGRTLTIDQIGTSETVMQSAGTLAAGSLLSITAASVSQTGGLMAAPTISVLGMGTTELTLQGTLAGDTTDLQSPQATIGASALNATFEGFSPHFAVDDTGFSVSCPGSCGSGTASVSAGVTLGPGSGSLLNNLTLVGSSIDITGTLSVGGTLAMYSEFDTTEEADAAIKAGTLTGSAGIPLATGWTLPTLLSSLPPAWTQQSLGWTSATTGNVVLGLPGTSGALTATNTNTLQALGTYLATGSIALADASSLTVTGPIVGGYGQTTGSVAILIAGNLAVDAPIVVTDVLGAPAPSTYQGSVSLQASGAVTLDGSATEVFAPTQVGIAAGASIDVFGAVVGAGSVTLQAPLVTLQHAATIVATGSGVAGGVESTARLTTVDDTSAIFSNGGITANALTTAGTVIAAGEIVANTLTQTDGTVAGNGLSVGALAQSGGIAASTGDVVVGSGSGPSAGLAGTVATGGGFDQAGGSLLAGGNVDIWSVGEATFGGDVQAGGTVGVTAGGASGSADLVQTGGLVAGTSVDLLSTAGNATQKAGSVAAGTASGDGVLVQAPAGSNDFDTIKVESGAPGIAISGQASLDCPACTVPPSLGPIEVTPLTVSAGLGSTAAMAPYPDTSPRVNVTLTGGTVVIDKPLIAGVLTLTSGGNTTETPTGSIDAFMVQGTAGGDALLAQLGVNHALALGAYTATGTFSLADALPSAAAATLTIDGIVSASTVDVAVSAGDLTLMANVNAGNSVDLGALGSLTQSTGIISTQRLTATAGSNVTLDDANAVGTLENLQAGGAGSLVDAQALTVMAAHADALSLTTTTGDLTLAGSVGGSASVGLRTAGSMTQTGGIIATPLLTATAAGNATLNEANAVGTLQSFVAGGTASLTNGQALTVAGAVTADTVGLTTTAGDMTLAGNVSGPIDVDLSAAGSITQTLGIIATRQLTAAAGANATLDDANAIGTLDNLQAGGAASLVDAQALTVAAAHAGSLGLTTTTGDLTLAGNVSGSVSVALRAAASLVQAGGIIATPLLGATASDDATVDDANAIGTLQSLAGSGAVSLVNAESLTVAGPVTAETVSLTTTAGELTLAGDVSGSASVDFSVAGSLAQTGGVVATPLLTAIAGGNATLDDANAIGTLASLRTGGSAALADAQPLTLAGPITAAAVTITAPEITVAAGVDVAAARIVLATGMDGGSITIQNGATLDASAADGAAGSLFIPGIAGFQAPQDLSGAGTGGVYLTIGSTTPFAGATFHNGFYTGSGAGSVTVAGSVDVAGPLLRVALPDQGSGTIGLGTIVAPPGSTPGNTVILVWLGDSGVATGVVTGQQVGAVETTANTVLNFTGTASQLKESTLLGPFRGFPAASVSGQGLYDLASGKVLYDPNAKLQLNGCAISSVNCQVLNYGQTVPPLIPSAPLELFAIPPEDLDILLPDVSDRED